MWSICFKDPEEMLLRRNCSFGDTAFSQTYDQRSSQWVDTPVAERERCSMCPKLETENKGMLMAKEIFKNFELVQQQR
jgi:hypothetical protein